MHIQLVVESFNKALTNPQKINYLAKLIGGKKIFIPDRPGEPKCSWANINKIKRELKWQPKISFEEGIGKMLAQIEKWKDAPLWDVDSIHKATKTWFQFMQK